MDDIEDLSTTVADLRARVEALERDLASLKTAMIPVSAGTTGTVDLVDLADKWDRGVYSEGDFVA